MKDLVDLRELFRSPAEYEGRNLTVCGWTRNRRNSKTFGFIMLNDGTSFNSVQVVYDQELANFDEIQHINIGASLIVEGKLLLTPEAQQAFEIHAEKITVEGASTPDYPLQPKPHSVEFLRTIPHLRARTNLFSAVFRIRSLAAHAIHCFFQERGFVYVHTPLITGSDCEGAGEMFRVTTLDPAAPPMTEEGNVDWSWLYRGQVQRSDRRHLYRTAGEYGLASSGNGFRRQTAYPCLQ